MATAVAQYVPQFVKKPNRFTLHNATPEELTIRWAGLQFSIPPCNVVDPKHTAVDADGDPIPGTYVVSDGYAPLVDGSYPKGGSYNWFAADVIQHALGINPDTGVAEGPFAMKGISFLPTSPTKEMVKNLVAEGKQRYDAFLVEWAQYEVAAQQTQESLATRAGRQPVPPGKDYSKALLILKKFETLQARQVGMTEQQVEEDSMEESIEFKTFALAQALKLAEKAAAEQQVDKNKLAESLMEDPQVKKHLQKQYRIRKVGHLPDEQE